MVWPDRMTALVICLVFLLLYPAVAKADVPVSYITEVVDAGYNTDGSVYSPVTRRGYVEVEVPNTQDVLQYLMLDLSGQSNTNLESTMAYRGAAASPTTGSRTRLYVNTTSSDSNISYEITTSAIAPVIYIRMNYSNSAGGRDIQPDTTNTFLFNVSINASGNLGTVTLDLRFGRNILGSADSMNLHDAWSSSGSVIEQDADSDGYYDSIRWVGTLSTSNVNIGFMGDTTPGTNFNENDMSVDLDQGTTSQAVYENDMQTFTGITFADRFSRGPIREGVTIMVMSNWATRGFITNMATGLDYRIHGWELYKMGESSPLLSSSTEVYPFRPGNTEYTDWYDTGVPGSQEKIGYYSVAWDWEVDWGSSRYTSISQATIILPVLYEIDSWLSKSAVLNSVSDTGVSVSIQDLARHVGHANLDVGRVTINSVLPRLSSGGASNTWTPSNIRVLFINGSGQIDLTSYASISTQPAGSSNGFVNVDISNLTGILGRGMRQNEDIRLEYDVSGAAHATTQTYSFCQTSTLVTESGTPVTKTECRDVVIPGTGGVTPTGGGGGGGGGGGAVQPPTLYAAIVRDVGEGYFVADNVVHVTATYSIVDTGTKGVKDIRAMIYIPEHGRLDASSLEFRVYDSSEGTWNDWVQDSDYRLIDNGITTLDGKPYREYLIAKIVSAGVFEEGLQLFNRDRIEIGYKTTVPVGSSFLVTRVSGYNYYDDSYMFEDLYIPVRREGVLLDPEITDTGWQKEKIYVGRPVRWIKSIEVHNPNNVSIEYVKPFEVFMDSLDASLLQAEQEREQLELKGEGNRYVDVTFRLGPDETKTYVIEVTTPPVLEVKRVVDVVESSDTEIKFMVNITLENFAEEDYDKVSLLFKSEPDNMVYVKEGGHFLNYTGFDDSTTEIFIGEMKSGWKRSISIVYTQVPPILLTAMSSAAYTCSDSATTTVFIVPAEREHDAYLEFEVVGPEPSLKTLNAQLIELRELWPWEEVEIPVRIDMRSLPDGRYSVYTSFKKNFETILSDRTDFTVRCPERLVISVSWVGFLCIAIAVIVYLVVRAWRRGRSGELDDIKRKLRELR